MTGKISDILRLLEDWILKCFFLNFRSEVFGLARQRHGITVRFFYILSKILLNYRQLEKNHLNQKSLKSLKVLSCLVTFTVSIDLIYLIITAVKSERKRNCSKLIKKVRLFQQKKPGISQIREHLKTLWDLGNKRKYRNIACSWSHILFSSFGSFLCIRNADKIFSGKKIRLSFWEFLKSI